MRVRFSYLLEKFENPDPILQEMKKLILTGDFTLGKPVQEFEKKFAEMLNVKYALGVANGTDAIRIPLRLAGVGPGDEVICPANTFIASVGAVVELFAKPVLIDMAPNHVMNAGLIERAITRKTKAILPVHFKGTPVDMDEVMHVANKHGIPVIEDTAQGFLGEYKGKFLGTIGLAGSFSLHPLKILNVMGDGGMITTNDKEMYEKILLYRNHGLKNRDEIASFGCNSRLDSIQAVVGLNQISITPSGVEKRRANAKIYNDSLRDVVQVSEIPEYTKPTHHLYMFEVDSERRDPLWHFLNNAGIEAKRHYPIPLQGAWPLLDHKLTDFPIAKKQSDRIITIPVDEMLTHDQIDFVIAMIRAFMGSNS
jgi:aminotransferase EvaB